MENAMQQEFLVQKYSIVSQYVLMLVAIILQDHQGSVVHVLKLDTYRYVPIPPLRIGMYFGMYFCTY